MPKIEKVCRNANTTSIAVSALHACSITKRDLSSCITNILVADVNRQGEPIVRKSQCQRPNKGASVMIVLYIAYGCFNCNRNLWQVGHEATNRATSINLVGQCCPAACSFLIVSSRPLWPAHPP